MHPALMGYSNEKYLEWVRRQPSCISGKFDAYNMDTGEQRNDPSHTWGTGSKSRKNDFCALPMTRDEHREQQDTGEKTFQEKYAIDFKDLIIEHMGRYIQENM